MASSDASTTSVASAGVRKRANLRAGARDSRIERGWGIKTLLGCSNDCRMWELRKTTGRRYTRGTGGLTCPRGQSNPTASMGPPFEIELRARRLPILFSYPDLDSKES